MSFNRATRKMLRPNDLEPQTGSKMLRTRRRTRPKPTIRDLLGRADGTIEEPTAPSAGTFGNQKNIIAQKVPKQDLFSRLYGRWIAVEWSGNVADEDETVNQRSKDQPDPQKAERTLELSSEGLRFPRRGLTWHALFPGPGSDAAETDEEPEAGGDHLFQFYYKPLRQTVRVSTAKAPRPTLMRLNFGSCFFTAKRAAWVEYRRIIIPSSSPALLAPAPAPAQRQRNIYDNFPCGPAATGRRPQSSEVSPPSGDDALNGYGDALPECEAQPPAGFFGTWVSTCPIQTAQTAFIYLMTIDKDKIRFPIAGSDATVSAHDCYGATAQRFTVKQPVPAEPLLGRQCRGTLCRCALSFELTGPASLLLTMELVAGHNGVAAAVGGKRGEVTTVEFQRHAESWRPEDLQIVRNVPDWRGDWFLAAARARSPMLRRVRARSSCLGVCGGGIAPAYDQNNGGMSPPPPPPPLRTLCWPAPQIRIGADELSCCAEGGAPLMTVANSRKNWTIRADHAMAVRMGTRNRIEMVLDSSVPGAVQMRATYVFTGSGGDAHIATGLHSTTAVYIRSWQPPTLPGTPASATPAARERISASAAQALPAFPQRTSKRANTKSRKEKPRDGDDPDRPIVVGDYVAVNDAKGVVCFVGRTSFRRGLWIGIEMDHTVGLNDGSVDGVRYFVTNPRRGIFVRLRQCRRIV